MPKTDLSDPAVQRLSIDQTLPWLPAIEVRGRRNFHRDRRRRDQEVDGRIQGGLACRPVWSPISTRGGLPGSCAPKHRCAIHDDPHARTCADQGADVLLRIRVGVPPGTSVLQPWTTTKLPMNGLLIYTASGDSEGTLGGLVSKGQTRSSSEAVRGRSSPGSRGARTIRSAWKVRGTGGVLQSCRVPRLRPASRDELRGRKQAA